VTKELQHANCDRICPAFTIAGDTFQAVEREGSKDVVLHKGALRKLNQQTQQRSLRSFELVKTTEAFVEIRCFKVSKKTRRSVAAQGTRRSTVSGVGEEQLVPSAVWQLNWTSTEALAMVLPANAGGSRKRSTHTSATEGTTVCPFSVAGLLNSKSQKQEQLVLEAETPEDRAQWVEAINEAMQELMMRALRQNHICGFKVLRIQDGRDGMVVSVSVWSVFPFGECFRLVSVSVW
jgi:hypothetical protein